MNHNKNMRKERERLQNLIMIITHESRDGEWTVSTDELRKEYNKGLPKAEKIIDLIRVKTLVQNIQKPLEKEGVIRYSCPIDPWILFCVIYHTVLLVINGINGYRL